MLIVYIAINKPVYIIDRPALIGQYLSSHHLSPYFKADIPVRDSSMQHAAGSMRLMTDVIDPAAAPTGMQQYF